jgi:dihydroneopterin aldolase
MSILATSALPAMSTEPSAAPNHGAAAEPLDLVFIEGFTGQTVIGIHDNELHTPQPLVIDVVAGLHRVAACDTDEIADTLDYSVLRQRLRQLLAQHRLKLLEAFAEAIADIVLGEFGAAWVRVKVVKPRKFDDALAMGVQIERRARPASAALAPATPGPATPGATVLRLIGAGMVPPLGPRPGAATAPDQSGR